MQARKPGQIQPRLQLLSRVSQVAGAGPRQVVEAGPPIGAEGMSQPSGKRWEEERYGKGQRMLSTGVYMTEIKF